MLWSKSQGLDEKYPLLSHQLDTAASAQALWDRWLRPDLCKLLEATLGPEARSWFAYVAGQHDTGKANPVFQLQLSSNRSEPWSTTFRQRLEQEGFGCSVPLEREERLRRHERVSALELASADIKDGGEIASNWISLTALGHHGKFQTPGTKSDRNAFRDHAGGRWKVERAQNTRVLREVCGLLPDTDPPPIGGVAATLLAGLVILADRTASEIASVTQAQARMRAGALRLNDPAGWISQQRDYFASRLEETLGIYQNFSDPAAARTAIVGDFELRPLQEAALKCGDGLWFAMAPTGSGKTEAALLRHSTCNERLIFALPTQATTNAMMKRIQYVFAGGSNVAELAHRLASIEDFYARSSEEVAATDDISAGTGTAGMASGLVPSEFLRNGTARLLAPVSVSTIDQVLAGSLRTKWAHLRLLTLANAHVVLDEAHLMDYYQSALAEQLMQWWGATGTRVTILTATLPTWQRDLFAQAYLAGARAAGLTSEGAKELPQILFPSHHELPGEAKLLQQQSYTIDLDLSEASEALGDSREAVSDIHMQWVLEHRTRFPFARLGVIANTVDRVQLIANSLREQDIPVTVLHSRMTAGHRRDATNALLGTLGPLAEANEQTLPQVLVGSQAVEASLDIDLDALSSDVAPAASLIQRAGRVWRHRSLQHVQRRRRRIPGKANLPIHLVYAEGVGPSLPYFASEMTRVREYLRYKRSLVMPDESQSFVDGTAVTLGDVSEENLRELANISREVITSQGIKISVADLQYEGVDFLDFSKLTGEDVEEESCTRLIDQPSITAIVIDEDGAAGVPGAWHGSLHELEEIDATDHARIRLAMEASVPLSGKIARAVISSYDGGERWCHLPKSRVISSMWPVVLSSSPITYDPLLGVRLKDTK
ncbi:CRISPR-associated helicase Cas3' [Leucobacter viscericola]|uniref:CRISPR-associated helicase Cas3 n=1 Tax=Leucobacter viscericola TaxID=2714935 RepID=A0A6G7XGN0_9MICO|nr:CRISPR-associated helicase Cas3' [Leucobacter viscericola]QIK63599.1 CRISPR-associated helicase Cas3' [Leucobacter viscericola]